jgi:uncharacterized membrane protein
MNSILQAVIGLSVVLVIFFALYYTTKENMIPKEYIYSDSKTYVSGVSYGVSILAGIALLVLVPIVLAEVLHK